MNITALLFNRKFQLNLYFQSRSEAFATFNKWRCKPQFLHRAIRDKLDVQSVSCWFDILRDLISTESSKFFWGRIWTIPDFQVVIDTVVMALNLQGSQVMNSEITEISLIRYSETCLIWLALGEKFCVGRDRVLDYRVKKSTEKWLNGKENQCCIKHRNRFHRCPIKQVLL